MVRSTNNLVVALIAFLAISCSKSAEKPWAYLEGNWKNTKNGSIESWTKLDDNNLKGFSYYLDNGDTVILEYIRLTWKNDSLFYIPRDPEQNGGDEVVFYATSISDTTLIFSNPNHDFPTTISYLKKSDSFLEASISGNIDGTYKEVYFPMKKMK